VSSTSVDRGVLKHVLARFRQATLGQVIGLLGLIVVLPEPLTHFQNDTLSFIGILGMCGTLIVRTIVAPKLAAAAENETYSLQPIQRALYTLLLVNALMWSLTTFGLLCSIPSDSESKAMILTLIAGVGMVGGAVACYKRPLLLAYIGILWASPMSYATIAGNYRLLFLLVMGGGFILASGFASQRMLSDVESRLLTEFSLKQYFQQVINAMPVRLLIVGPDLDIRFANSGFDSLLADPTSQHRRTLQDVLPSVALAVKELAPQSSVQFEVEVSAPDRRWQLISIQKLSNTDETMIAAIDVDEQRRAERRELEMRAKAETASRLATLGQVAGGIAHEINNPLAIIIARVEALIQNDAELSPAARRDALEKIDKTAERIAKIIRSMRALGRDGKQDPAVRVDLSEVLNDTLTLFEQKLKNRNVSVKIAIPPHQVFFFRPVELIQVLTNLISNALDAVSELEPESERWIEVTAEPAASSHLRISVRNGGPKIPEAITQRIGTPFFTTKPPGSGTGLGITIVQKLARENDAQFGFNRDETHTCFYIEGQTDGPATSSTSA